MSVQEFDISADFALLPHGEEGVHLKISSPQIEVNVWLPSDEAAKLSALPSHSPELEPMRLGLSVGKAVHWSRDAHGLYYLLVGEDHETWDVGLTLNSATFRAILNAIKHPIR